MDYELRILLIFKVTWIYPSRKQKEEVGMGGQSIKFGV